MIAGLFVVYGRDYIELCKKLGKEEEVTRAQKHVDAMVASVAQHGWDGEWFLRAYDFYGNKLGSNGRKRVEKEFTIELMAERVIGLYKSILENK